MDARFCGTLEKGKKGRKTFKFFDVKEF